MTELEIDMNMRIGEWSILQESGRELTPCYGPGYTGLSNLGNRWGVREGGRGEKRSGGGKGEGGRGEKIYGGGKGEGGKERKDMVEGRGREEGAADGSGFSLSVAAISIL